MKKGKVIKVFTFIMPLVLVAMLSGCGVNEPVSVDVSGSESLENENQEVDSSGADSVVSSDGVSDGKIERVDNPDGGWTISEYGETGEEVRQSIYDAEGNLKQVNKYEGVDPEWKLLEETYYDGDGKLNNTVTYTYYANGSLKSTSECDGEGQTKIVSYRYNANGDLKSTSERIIGRKMVDRGNAGTELAEEMTLQIETEHFAFYSTSRDIAVLDVIAETLEGYYTKVTSDLKIEPRDKTKIYVSPSLEEHHKAVGRPDDPDWSVGEAKGGDIYMVSPLNPGPAHSYDEMFDIVVHEFTHVVAGQYGGRLPTYLNEGIATYEAGQGNSSEFYVRSDMTMGTLPSLKEMAGWGSYIDIDDASRAYAYGYVYIDFALEADGYDTVVSLLEGKTMTEAFGMDIEELNEKWMDFLASYER